VANLVHVIPDIMCAGMIISFERKCVSILVTYLVELIRPSFVPR